MAFCTNCGEPVESGNFCPKCGAAVGRQTVPPPPSNVPGPPPAGYGAYPGQPPGKKFPVWGIVAIIVAVLVIMSGIVVAIVVPVFSTAQNTAQRRTCQANQRTILSAIQVYYAEDGKYPPAGEVGDILVPDLMKTNPTCPTSGKPYTINRGDPPGTACPTHVPGHTI